MTFRRAALETAYIGVLAVWLGLLIMTGVAAATLFPMLKSLAPTLPEFALYTGDHWRIAGGQIANRLFTISDIAGVILIAAAAALLAISTYLRHLTYSALAARWASLMLPAIAMAINLFVLHPRMGRTLTAFYAAAAAGQGPRADVLQTALDSDHPLSTALMVLLTASVLIALVVAAWSLPRTASSTRRIAVGGGVGGAEVVATVPADDASLARRG